MLSTHGFGAIYTSGHGDLGLGEGTKLEPHIHLHAGAFVNGAPLPADGEYEPDALSIVVPQSTFNFVVDNGGRAAGVDWDPIGVAAGEGYYYLPESSGGPGGATALGAPFFGIGAEEVTPGHFDNDSLTLTLTNAVMPAGGQFSMWQNGISPTFYMSTNDGISSADAFTLTNIALSDHDHVNWGFTTAGTYVLTFEVSAMVGGIPETASADFTFFVPEPSTYGLLAGGLTLAIVAIRRKRRN